MTQQTEHYLEHVTVEGERWDQIAYRYYGDPMGYVRIIMANPHVAILPVFTAGIVLAIPVIASNAATEEVPPWLQ